MKPDLASFGLSPCASCTPDRTLNEYHTAIKDLATRSQPTVAKKSNKNKLELALVFGDVSYREPTSLGYSGTVPVGSI